MHSMRPLTDFSVHTNTLAVHATRRENMRKLREIHSANEELKPLTLNAPLSSAILLLRGRVRVRLGLESG